MLTSADVKAKARELGATVCGIGKIYHEDNPQKDPYQILPNAKCIIGFGFALKIEQVAGYYACKECGHKYVPPFKSMNLAPHMGRTRYMRCPECGKKSWQKKVIRKD